MRYPKCTSNKVHDSKDIVCWKVHFYKLSIIDKRGIMKNNTTTDTNGTVTEKQVSLEELDVLCRQYNHLHDEEVLRIVARFFTKISTLFKHEKHEHCHSSAR